MNRLWKKKLVQIIHLLLKNEKFLFMFKNHEINLKKNTDIGVRLMGMKYLQNKELKLCVCFFEIAPKIFITINPQPTYPQN
jgi:hypothetical protein